VIDIASRQVVGYALAGHLRTELVAYALANAVAARDPQPGVIFHSDLGSTPPPPSPGTAGSPRRWVEPVNAGTTPSPRASAVPKI
jgi:transposase InsO family protein